MTRIVRISGNCEFRGNPARVRRLVFADYRSAINGRAI